MSIAASACNPKYTLLRLIKATTRRPASAAIDQAYKRSQIRLFTTTAELHITSHLAPNGNSARLFLNALVQASCVRACRGRWITRAKAVPATKRGNWVQSAISYNRLPLLIRGDIERIGIAFFKKCLLGLVDHYNDSEGNQDMASSAHKDHEMAEVNHRLDMREHTSRAAYLETLNRQQIQTLLDISLAMDTIHRLVVPDQKRERRKDMTAEVDHIFRLYHSLPAARFLCLGSKYRGILLDLVMYVPKKTEMTTLRFLSVLNDMRQVRVRIPKNLYNHAIHLVGRTMTRVSDQAVESALRHWTSMETLSSGDTTTFNILLDVSVKGQQFGLAEMVIAEMEQRGLRPDLFTRTGLIYYHGVRGDGDSIRRTYRELVEDDTIVDTSVLNCVMASLLRAGEAEAAQHVYQRMKSFAESQNQAQEVANGTSVVLTKALPELNHHLEPDDVESPEQLQSEQDISPDEKTFSIFVSHHVSKTGDLETITGWLDDMQRSGITPHGRLFLDLFRGFTFHGGVRFTSWNRTTLEKVWLAFQGLANEPSNNRVFWGRWVVIWILRAYIQCFDYGVAMDRWTTIKTDWDKASVHEAFILSLIAESDRKKVKGTRTWVPSAVGMMRSP